MELRRYASILWTYKKMIALLFLATIITVIAGTYIFSPIYTATAVVQVQPEAAEFLVFNKMGESQLVPLTIDPLKMLAETNSKIITSRAVAAQVVNALGLHRKEKPEKNPFLRVVKSTKKFIKDSLMIAWDILKYGRYIKPTDYEAAVEGVQRGLFVEANKDTSLISIETGAKDPKTAADIANAAARVFVEYKRELTRKQADILAEDLKRPLDQRRDNLTRAELALSEFKKSKGLASIDDQTSSKIVALVDAESQLDEANAQIKGIRTKLGKIRGQIAMENREIKLSTKTTASGKAKDSGTNTSGTTGTSTVIGSGSGSSKTTGSSEIKVSESTSLNTTETSKNSISGSSSLESTSATDSSQESSIVNDVYQNLRENTFSLERDLGAWQAKKSELEAAIQRYNNELKNLPEDAARLLSLTREVQIAEGPYLRLQKSLEDTQIRQDYELNEVSLVDPATPPRYFSKPIKIKYVGIGALVSLLIGISIAFLAEYINPRIRMAEDVASSLQLPVLAVIPSTKINGNVTKHIGQKGWLVI